MAIRKYASDYRLDQHIHPSGKPETVRVYQGPLFDFCAPKEVLRVLRNRILFGAALVIIGLLPLLFNNTWIGRTFYVVLPMAFTLIPWCRMIAAAWRLTELKCPLTREQKDKTDVRLRTSTCWLAGLLALTLAGCIVYGFRAGFAAGEWVCLAGLVLSMLASAYLLTLRDKAKTKQRETAPQETQQQETE